MSQIPSGMPITVTSANQAMATTIPEANQPMNNHQMIRTKTPGPRWYGVEAVT